MRGLPNMKPYDIIIEMPSTSHETISLSGNKSFQYRYLSHKLGYFIWFNKNG
jgi:hypothetical protein